MKKIDMSISCGLCQEAMALKEYRGEISHEAFRHWYDNHCAKCIHESVVCMYGEEDPPIDQELLVSLHPELNYMF